MKKQVSKGRRRNTSLTSTHKNVIELVKKARLNKGYSQRQLSALLDTWPSFVFLVEAERATIPLYKVNEYCLYLHIGIRDYLKAYLKDRENDFVREVYSGR